MSDAVTVYRMRNDDPTTLMRVLPYQRDRANDFGFYVNLWIDGKRTTKSVKNLAAMTFPDPDNALPEPRTVLPEYPSYSFYIQNGRVRAFSERRELRSRRHPRGKQNYFSLVDYTGKRSSVRESSLLKMCEDEQ